MCGIFGVVGVGGVVPALVGGLQRLEYRGYDSAGLVIATESGLVRRRTVGKVAALERLVRPLCAEGMAGIGHTRWATHGAATETNAHPHIVGRVAVVHNGIIENHQALRAELIAGGADFKSETDSEVVPWLIAQALRDGAPLETAVLEAVSRLEGAYAVAVISADAADRVIAARRGSPLAIGFGEGCMLLSSDSMALAAHCATSAHLEDGDLAILTRDGVEILDENGRSVRRASKAIAATPEQIALGDHPHFMHKEMHEQPRVARRLLESHGDNASLANALPFDFARIDRLTLIASGSSHHAALIARSWFERWTDLSVEVDVGSEYRYRRVGRDGREAAILISQSGESADTLACLDGLRRRGVTTLGLVNDPGSTLTRLADGWLDIGAGPEIGIASTKTFTAQLTLLARLAVAAAVARRGGVATSPLLDRLRRLPELLEQSLRVEPAAFMAAGMLASARNALVIGRGEYAALALEGALKLKEISYIHAEGCAAGELGHGPIALIEPGLPIIALAFAGTRFAKTAANIEAALARGGRIILVGDALACEAFGDVASFCLPVPVAPSPLQPILAAIPLQLLAYHTAVARGANVDQPRHRAKTVTVA